jgi:hypothetical protein
MLPDGERGRSGEKRRRKEVRRHNKGGDRYRDEPRWHLPVSELRPDKNRGSPGSIAEGPVCGADEGGRAANHKAGWIEAVHQTEE